MKNFLLFFVCFLGLSFFSCTKQPQPEPDPCGNVTCLNSGYCDQGTCICPGGVSGVNCEIVDSCYNVYCMNGYCDGGICICPQGYYGPSCQYTVTPTSMTINKIVINTYPTLRTNSNTWDFGSNADVFVTFAPGTSSSQSYMVTNTIANVSGQALTYETTGLPYTVLTPGSNWSIGIWDDDGSPQNNEFISGIYFAPNDKSTGLPDSFQVNTSSMIATLYVDWTY